MRSRYPDVQGCPVDRSGWLSPSLVKKDPFSCGKFLDGFCGWKARPSRKCQHQTSWGNGIMKRERSVESYGKGKLFGWVEEGLSERGSSEKNPGRCGRTLTKICSFETSFDASYDTVDGRNPAPSGMYKTLQCFALILDRISATEPRIQSKGPLSNANPCHDKFR